LFFFFWRRAARRFRTNGHTVPCPASARSPGMISLRPILHLDTRWPSGAGNREIRNGGVTIKRNCGGSVCWFRAAGDRARRGGMRGARIIEGAGFPPSMDRRRNRETQFSDVPDLGLTAVAEVGDHVAAAHARGVSARSSSNAAPLRQCHNMGRHRAAPGEGGREFILELQDLRIRCFRSACGHFEGKDVIPASEMVGQDKGRSTRAP